MNDYFGRVAARVLGAVPRVTPRRASRYEPQESGADLDSSGLPDGRWTQDAEPLSIRAASPRRDPAAHLSVTPEPNEPPAGGPEDAAHRPPRRAIVPGSDPTPALDGALLQPRVDAAAGSGPSARDRQPSERPEPARRAATPEDGPTPGSVLVVGRVTAAAEDRALESELLTAPESGRASSPGETVRGPRSPASGGSAAVAAPTPLRTPGADGPPEAEDMAGEPAPVESASRRPTTGSRRAPRGAVAVGVTEAAAIESAGPSPPDGNGTITVSNPTVNEPEPTAPRPPVTTNPESSDDSPHDRPSHPFTAPDAGVDQSPVVRVTIGRVEVRAVQPAADAREPHPPAPASPPDVLSLDDYLEQRKDMWR